ncbi:PB1 domain-containing protein [Ditylenchus destructor]|nr:PB1 domain-containing protein [Ditylenchus destructor]
MHRSDAQSSIVKCRYGTTFRKWKLRHDSDMTLHGLKTKVQYLFNIQYLGAITLRYRDSDGDWINLTDDDDLFVAVSTESSLLVEVTVDEDYASQPRSPVAPRLQRSLEKLSTSSPQHPQLGYGASDLQQQNHGLAPSSQNQQQQFALQLPPPQNQLIPPPPSVAQHNQSGVVPPPPVYHQQQYDNPSGFGQIQSRAQNQLPLNPSANSSVAGNASRANPFQRNENQAFLRQHNQYY